jgi:hypothetical protein
VARDAIDIKESLDAVVKRPRQPKRPYDELQLERKEDPGNRAMRGELGAEVNRALEAAAAEETDTDKN